jgi:hypothetical protein
VLFHQVDANAAGTYSSFVDLRARNGVVFDHAAELGDARNPSFAVASETFAAENRFADSVAVWRDVEDESIGTRKIVDTGVLIADL